MGNKVIVTRSKLDLLADSISAKSGVSLPLTIGEMKIAVDGIILNTQIIGDGDLNIDENDYLYFDDEGEIVLGTKTITENGTYNASSDSLSGYSSVTVNVVGSSTQTQTKTATPTESQQTITPDNGYLLSSVTVNAISSTYVGSGINQNDSDDLTISDATVTVPAGYYAESASKSVASGSATTPSTTITANPSISINSSGLITATTSASQNITPSISAGYVSSGTSGTITVSGLKTQQLTTQSAKTVTPTESEQTAVASGVYTTGIVKVGAISSTYVGSGINQNDSDDLTVSGATVTASAGYYEESVSKSVDSGIAGTPTATKGTVSNHQLSITPSVTNTTGYITGGTKTGTAVTVTASELASGNKTISANGTDINVVGYSTVSVDVEPNLQAKTNINPTTSSQTISPDSGYDGLSSVQINAMPTMTLPTSTSSSSSGTSKATIGRNTSAQYINIPTGYNETASYYTISATPNGSVTAPSSISGTSATVSTGTNTLTLTKTVSVTPNVTTAGYISSGTAGNSSVSLTASVTTKGATTYNTSTTDQTIASGTYLTGTQTIRGVTVSGLDASKILSGTTIMVGDSADADRIASVSGTVTFSTITVSSSNPSGGSPGDIWIKTN